MGNFSDSYAFKSIRCILVTFRFIDPNLDLRMSLSDLSFDINRISRLDNTIYIYIKLTQTSMT